MSLIGGLPIPFHRLGRVFGYANALKIMPTECELCLCLAFLRLRFDRLEISGLGTPDRKRADNAQEPNRQTIPLPP